MRWPQETHDFAVLMLLEDREPEESHNLSAMIAKKITI